MSLDSRVAGLPYESSSFATSRGNEKIGGTGYCVTYDTDSQSRNVLASPLGEEGHEVAKGWTVVRMIMIFLFYVLSPPTEETTHYILRVASAPSSPAVTGSLDFQVAAAPLQIQFASAKCVRCASLRSGGRRLAVRKMIEYHISAQPRTPFCHYVAFPLKGKRENRWHWILCHI